MNIIRNITFDNYLDKEKIKRVHQQVPPGGMIQVFIRSHYEDILVPTVEKLFPPEKIEERYEIINGYEKLLEQNGTRVLKFFLNVSKEAQLFARVVLETLQSFNIKWPALKTEKFFEVS